MRQAEKSRVSWAVFQTRLDQRNWKICKCTRLRRINAEMRAQHDISGWQWDFFYELSFCCCSAILCLVQATVCGEKHSEYRCVLKRWHQELASVLHYLQQVEKRRDVCRCANENETSLKSNSEMYFLGATLATRYIKAKRVGKMGYSQLKSK